MTELKQQFERDGFVVLKGFLSQQQVSQLQSNTERFIEQTVATIPAHEVYYEDKADSLTLKQVQHVCDYDDYYHQLANSDAVVNLAQELLGGSVELKNMQYFNKVAHIGQATPAHQDGFYFKIKPQQAVTMWLSLGHADAVNGAVCYIPGSHLAGLRAHGRTGTLGFSQGITDWSAADTLHEQQMVAAPGDLLVHHSLTIHRANANMSDRTRQSVGFIFYRSDVQEDKAAHDDYKQQLMQNLTLAGKISSGGINDSRR